MRHHACHGTTRGGVKDPVSPDLVTALLAQPGDVAGEPVQTTIAGRPAIRIDLAVPNGADLESCHLADYGPPALQIWFSDASDKCFVLSPEWTASVFVVDVDGGRQVFLTQQGPEVSEADLRELEAMVESIRIV